MANLSGRDSGLFTRKTENQTATNQKTRSTNETDHPVSTENALLRKTSSGEIAFSRARYITTLNTLPRTQPAIVYTEAATAGSGAVPRRSRFFEH